MARPLESRVSALEKSSARHDREIAAIRKLLIQGAKILVRIEQRVDDLTRVVDGIARRLDDTNKTLDRFIRSLERIEPNGRGKTKIN